MLKQIQKYLKNIDLEIISNLSLIIKLLITLFSILVSINHSPIICHIFMINNA